MDFLLFVKEFVEGEISVEEFQNEVINNEGLQKFFDENIKTLPKFIKDRSPSLWVYIACLDAEVPGDRYDMHTIITQLFKESNFKPTQKYADDFKLFLDLVDVVGDVDNLEFLDKLIYDLPDITFAEKRKVLKKRIKEIFVYDKNPPKWIEEPYWQFRNGKPMKFKEQYSIYDGCRYVFYDDEGEIEIEQYD